MINLIKYDLTREAAKLRTLMKEKPDPIVHGRNLLSDAILGQVLMGLSDIGVYEELGNKEKLELTSFCKENDLNQHVLQALMDYCTGRQLLKKDGETYSVTEEGNLAFNCYTRGILNVYLGGYNPYFFNLTSILRRDSNLSDYSRSTQHAAAGTALATCVFCIPKVVEVMEKYGSKRVVDLGCGTGDFLINMLRAQPHLTGIGIDMSPEAIGQAKKNAEIYGIEDRISFHVHEVGSGPIKLPEKLNPETDMMTSMYMLHELGRDGDDAIVKVLGDLRRDFTGCKLLLMEVDGCDMATYKDDAGQGHYGRLDYLLIHVLSEQGLPMHPEQWHGLFQRAELETLEKGVRTGGSYIYVVGL